MDGSSQAGSIFDGQSAWEYTRDLVTLPDGTPRYRVPGTSGHAEAADWLQDAMQLPGWTVSRQSFTGAEVAGLYKGDLLPLYQEAVHCPVPARQRRDRLRFHNLVATFGPPTDPQAQQPERWLWLAAHWDSKRQAGPEAAGQPVPGANDGGSGVGLLLQLMRHVAAGDIDLPVRLGVVFFDGEDGFEDCHALAGSLYFVQRMERHLLGRLLLLDMVGDPQARFVREQISLAADPAMVELLWKYGRRLASENFTDIRTWVADDHKPFVDLGIPAVDLIDWGRPGSGHPPWWHTAQDTMQHVDPAMLARVGEVILAVLGDPGLTDNWPCRFGLEYC